MFDNIVFTAAQILRVATAAIVLVDHDRNWVKAVVGPPGQDQTVPNLLMRFVVATGELLIVEDVLTDGRFQDAVQSVEPGLRFCIMAPLLGPDRQVVGCLLACDTQARNLPTQHIFSFGQLARQAGDLLRLRVPNLDMTLVA